ncbi:MAG TPA: serine/threonine-protein kinase [Ktedonosporobacter sp.]|nr:serine/threonine-protein kinase [Ktedonosporobacter sp.]
MSDYCEGQQFGIYHLRRLLGRKDCTEVYLGEHLHQHTQVAIKLLYGRREQDEATKFLIQAGTLTELRHSHIVSVLDYGIEDDVSFLVMDYAPHGSLRERHPKRTRLPLDMVLHYARQIADALYYVHQRNLVHRDVKPHNMLLAADDRVMLSDFGIAVVSHSLASIHPELSDFEGTVPYAAPEQLQGKPRRSSDQYALGIVVYEWLTSDWPFSGSFDEVAHHHLFTPPPSFKSRGVELPLEVEQVVMRALEKDPARRFATIGQFVEALGVAIEQRDVVEVKDLQQSRRQFRSPRPFSI